MNEIIQPDTLAIEAQRYIRKVARSGALPSVVKYKTDDICRLVDSEFVHDKYGCAADEFVPKLMAEIKEMSRKNLTIFVCGADRDSRFALVSVLLSKVILHNLAEVGEIGMLLPYCDVIVKFNTYLPERFVLLENMKKYRALCISEIDPNIQRRGDAIAMFNSVLESRRTHDRVTILSIDCPDFENIFALKATDNNSFTENELGSMFRDLVKTKAVNNANVKFIKAAQIC